MSNRENIANIVARAKWGALHPGLGEPNDVPGGVDEHDYRAADAICEMIAAPRPIEDAPLDGRWILACDPSIKYPRSFHGPWVIATRSDQESGWADGEGNEVSPTLWLPLPDPQPDPTKWLPAEGTICVDEITGDGWTSNGEPIAVPWRWMIYIERLDGTLDEYREHDLAVTFDEALAKANSRWVDKFHLPVVVRPLNGVQ